MENSEIPARQDEDIDQVLEIEGTSVKALEVAIGRQVRTLRKRLNLTVANVAKQAQLSSGMLSKIENGLTSPSLATLNALANALHVPVTALFRGYEEQSDVTYIKSGGNYSVKKPEKLLDRILREFGPILWY